MLFYEMVKTDMLLDWDESMKYETVKCPVDDGHQRAGKRNDPLTVRYGEKTEDIMWTMFECVITDKTLQIFKEEGLTGFEVKPVKVVKRSLFDKPPVLWELVVTGWAGIAPESSGISLLRECEACGSIKYSKPSCPQNIVSELQWDGSDFFMVWPLPVYRFVTDKVKQLCESFHLTGVSFLNPLDYSIDKFKYHFSPGRLHYYMPEARAHELGDKLGIYQKVLRAAVTPCASA